MIVSSHSSYIAHEVGFDKLRYFKRKSANEMESVPSAEVIDLSTIFSDQYNSKNGRAETAKFVTRYLKTTHCDLFFANGIILVEGAAERMLLPHFISTKYNDNNGLNSSYISILEVGGAHAQRLRPLIDALGLPTLVITDTDAEGKDGKKVLPLRNKSYFTGSNTLKHWFNLKENTLDEIIDLASEQKIIGNVRVAYQTGIIVHYLSEENEAIPYTFEDAIALTNLHIFRELDKPTGMMRKMKEAVEKDSLEECSRELFNCLGGEKAKMALDLLFDVDPEELSIPKYIKEGLDWLENELQNVSNDFCLKESVPRKDIQ